MQIYFIVDLFKLCFINALNEKIVVFKKLRPTQLS